MQCVMKQRKVGRSFDTAQLSVDKALLGLIIYLHSTFVVENGYTVL